MDNDIDEVKLLWKKALAKNLKIAAATAGVILAWPAVAWIGTVTAKILGSGIAITLAGIIAILLPLIAIIALRPAARRNRA
jgi:hypothetical protein